jgi:hypothetical protein
LLLTDDLYIIEKMRGVDRTGTFTDLEKQAA